jgi:hypothetical protein
MGPCEIYKSAAFYFLAQYAIMHLKCDREVERRFEDLFNAMDAINKTATMQRINGMPVGQLEKTYVAELTKFGQAMFDYLFLESGTFLSIDLIDIPKPYEGEGLRIQPYPYPMVGPK